MIDEYDVEKLEQINTIIATQIKMAKNDEELLHTERRDEEILKIINKIYEDGFSDRETSELDEIKETLTEIREHFKNMNTITEETKFTPDLIRAGILMFRILSKEIKGEKI